ncbi:MAG: TolC family protein, partial [Candidatus Binatia bacterium]
LGVLETDGIRLAAARKALRAALNELRSRPPEAVEPLGDLPPAAPVAEPVVAASPERDSLDARLREATAERRSAFLAYFPDLLVQGMAEQPRDRGMEEPMWGAMLGVSLPVFWFRKQEELLAAADAEREAALAEHRSLENRLEAEIVAAREALETARATADLYEGSVLPATELALASARSGYAVGRVALPDLVSVARARTVQALEHLAARIDVELARGFRGCRAPADVRSGAPSRPCSRRGNPAGSFRARRSR